MPERLKETDRLFPKTRVRTAFARAMFYRCGLLSGGEWRGDVQLILCRWR